MTNPRDRILGKITGKSGGSKKLTESDIPRMYHEFMMEYGWISLEEYSNISLPVFWDLWACIMDDRTKTQERMDNVKKKGRR